MRLIDADKLKEAINTELKAHLMYLPIAFKDIIDNAPTEFDDKAYSQGYAQGTIDTEHALERPQGEWEDFAKFVAKEVLDDYFEENAGSFAEIACRKLVKLGLVELKDNEYRMRGGAE